MIGLTIAALVMAWFAGFGACYSVTAKTTEREVGRWVFYFTATAAVIFAVLALTVTK